MLGVTSDPDWLLVCQKSLVIIEELEQNINLKKSNIFFSTLLEYEMHCAFWWQRIKSPPHFVLNENDLVPRDRVNDCHLSNVSPAHAYQFEI